MGIEYGKLDPNRPKLVIIGIGEYGNRVAEKYFDDGFEYVDIYEIRSENRYTGYREYDEFFKSEANQIGRHINHAVPVIISEDIEEANVLIKMFFDLDVKPDVFFVVSKVASVDSMRLSSEGVLYFIADLGNDIEMLALRRILDHHNKDHGICVDIADHKVQQNECSVPGSIHGFEYDNDRDGKKIENDINNLISRYADDISGVAVFMSYMYGLEKMDEIVTLFANENRVIVFGDFTSTRFEVSVIVYSK